MATPVAETKKGGRATKLVHLRSPREIARWLGEVTRPTAEVAD